MKSIIQKEKECFICGRVHGLDEHHVFGGARRKLSEKYGLKVWLCHNTCHIFGNRSVHKNAEADRFVKAAAQRCAMEEYNWSIEDFIGIFGRSYI